MENSRQKESEIQQEKEEVNASESFTCEICIEPLSVNKTFKNKSDCAHSFCEECIAKYIKVQIENHTARIPCPGLNCPQVLDPLWCRNIIPASDFSKWCDVLCDSYVLGFKRSYCPNRNCRALVVNECAGSVTKSKCPNCKTFFCFRCKLVWHAGYGCREARNLRDPNDILFGQVVEKEAWRRCPGCGQFIERLSGCNSVRCRCKTVFCYRCGRKIPGGLSICKCRDTIHCNCRWLEPLFFIVGLLVVTIFIVYHSFYT